MYVHLCIQMHVAVHHLLTRMHNTARLSSALIKPTPMLCSALPCGQCPAGPRPSVNLEAVPCRASPSWSSQVGRGGCGGCPGRGARPSGATARQEKKKRQPLLFVCWCIHRKGHAQSTLQLSWQGGRPLKRLVRGSDPTLVCFLQHGPCSC